MITAFIVKNFKAIGEEEVKIELKPITLLFGANSAGKSSILHALNYAHSVFNDYNLNAEYNTHSDSSFNLGGFSRFVHGNDLDRSVVLRFELDFKAKNDIPDECLDNHDLPLGHEEYYDSIPAMLDSKELLKDVRSAYVEVKITWSNDQKRPYVSDYETGLGSEWIARIKAKDYKKEISVCGFNIAHPIFKDIWIEYGILMDRVLMTFLKSEGYTHKFTEKYQDAYKKSTEKYQDAYELIEQNQDDAQDNEFRTPKNRLLAFENLGRVPASDFTLSYNLNFNLLKQEDALPRRYQLPIDKRVIKDHRWPDRDDDKFDVGFPYTYVVEEDKYRLYKNGKITAEDLMNGKPIMRLKEETCRASIGALVVAFEDLLNSVLVAPRLQVTKWLESICYLGPLREIPPRNFTGDSLNNEMNRWRWERGLAAWDELYRIGQQWSEKSAKSLGDINDWLAGDQRLNTGYRIEIEHYREIPSLLLDKILAANQLLTDIPELNKEICRLPEKIRILLEDIRWPKDKPSPKLTPHEIGVGISQVLPVVVAAVGANAQLVAIEQPELHIHSALQVQLGDLFIDQSKDREKLFLIETHSEHLLLRLLRRINENFEHKSLSDMKSSTVENNEYDWLDNDLNWLDDDLNLNPFTKYNNKIVESKLPPDIEPFTAKNIAIYYLKKGLEGLCVRRLEISEDGDSKGDWPEGFFGERRAELF